MSIELSGSGMGWPVSNMSMGSRYFALVPAAGSGSRAGLGAPKKHHRLAGRRVLDHTLAALAAVPAIAGIAVVLAPDDDSTVGDGQRVRAWRVGGASRAESVADRKSTRLNSSHIQKSRMPSSA